MRGRIGTIIKTGCSKVKTQKGKINIGSDVQRCLLIENNNNLGTKYDMIY
jgi:hypothetical protein